MHPSSAKTERVERRRRALAAALATIASGVGGMRLLAPRGRGFAIALLSFGVLLLAVRFARPQLAARLVAPLERALGLVGELVGTVSLTIFYVLFVVPYARVMRAIGRIPPPHDEFPGTGSGWTRIRDGERIDVRTASTHTFGRLIGDLRAAALFLRFLSGRPSAVLIPVVVVVLLFAAALLVGEVTGLGPLVYSIF